MSADTIRRILFTPPVAIARLGGSSGPMEAFDWGPGDPHTIGETRIRPAWTLGVDAEGNVDAYLPTDLRVRDGALHRPVAPFLELWALIGDGDATTWTPTPVTPNLLAINALSETAVRFTVTAMNRKAARRTRDPRLRFGTFPPLTLTAADHRRVPLRGQSPPDVLEPLIPPGRQIPLGFVQVTRPRSQPPAALVPAAVRLDALRIRITPAAGLCYGPPQAAGNTSLDGPAVPLERAFLNPSAGWMGAAYLPNGVVQTQIVSPPDTYDMFDRAQEAGGVSLGVVDDTCELSITATVSIPGAADPLQARANVMVGPPHFAPDRRPFLSLADEINDREHDPARDAALTARQLDDWVEDLFERTYETASLLDLDYWRQRRAAVLPKDLRRETPLPLNDGVPDPDPARAMGGRDKLRDPDIAIAAPRPQQPRPLAQRARERHRSLADIAQLKGWALGHPERLKELIRAPFAVDPVARPWAVTTMRMPPLMRNSNALPLSLTDWQYRLLMRWHDTLQASGEVVLDALNQPASPLSSATARRRAEVLALLAEAQP